MKESKIVTLEDRIPKLKQQRRRKANRRLIALLLVFFSLIAGVIYIQSPLSHVKTINVTGNEMYSTQQVIMKTGITRKTNIWKVTKKEVSARLKALPEIKEAKISIHWPNTLNIHLKEYQRIAYLSKDSAYYPVLENGKILESRKSTEVPVNAPVLFEFKEGKALNKMVEDLKGLPEAVINSISEIHYSPEKTDDYHISLFMNDGFEVSATLRTFVEKMSEYPSIISQLDPNKKGIIDLEVGSYFTAYPTEGDVSAEKNQSKR
ncbi:MAG: cell division protein FtsQ/DivIB [Bacillota bacterium]|nr:cell division protein FtsQ/DivIB [Bacillota bacterium]